MSGLSGKNQLPSIYTSKENEVIDNSGSLLYEKYLIRLIKIIFYVKDKL
ncbi:hypothetical protein DSOL_4258 [Desulfosporosinus metallidurans]|uniref:Uncharacterized protein n=1 Tax=Desulfosporosinus metallidurans TaxID=1888891 RepID=A0A1Q8QKY1_9FIRM|nr:hypothetical protein DSOL_4258 [Desulfosporosinus metallidurans]